MQYFHLAAILLLDHDESGSYGIILNRPSDYRMGQLQLSKDLGGQFDTCRLHVGGDVGDSSLQILHSVQGLPGEGGGVTGSFVISSRWCSILKDSSCLSGMHVAHASGMHVAYSGSIPASSIRSLSYYDDP